MNLKYALKSVFYKIKYNPLSSFEYIFKLKYNFLYDFDFVRKKYSNFEFLGEEETLDLILSGKSLVRYGDGEIEIIRGLSIYSGIFNHRYFKELSSDLKRILNEKNKDLVVAIPHKYLIENAKDKIHWQYSQYNYYKYLNSKISYGDAFVFREISDKTVKKLTKFLAKKDLIFVGNSSSKLLPKNKVFSKAEFVKVPNNDSYKEFDRIYNDILKKVSKFDKKNVLVLIGCGPVANVLVDKLSKKGIQAIDHGAVFDIHKSKFENYK